MSLTLPGVLTARPGRREWSFAPDRLILWGAGGLIGYLVLAPLAMLLFSSIKSTADRLPIEPGPLTVQNYVRVFLSADTYRLLGTTLGYGAGSLVVALSLAASFAWLLERSNIPGRSLLSVLLLAPMAVPPMMLAITFILLASPTIGLVNVVLRAALHIEGNAGPLSIYSLPGMMLVSGVAMVPSVYLMLAGAFRNMDPALEESSAMSGATMRRTFARITLPLMRPAVLAAAAYFLIVMVEAFEIPALLGNTAGIHVFSTQVYQATHPGTGLPDYGLASGYGMVLLALAGVLILGYQRIVAGSERFAVIGAKGYRPRTIDLGRWRWAALGAAILYLFWALVLPLLILVWASLLDFYSPPGMDAVHRLSLANYVKLAHYPNLDVALKNTLVAGVVAALATMLLASVSSWMAVRGQFQLHGLPDALTFLTLGVPSIVLGLALIFLYLTVPIPIYGTVWILIVAYVTRFLSYGSRIMVSAQVQLQRELEEAGRMSGAAWLQVFRRIVLVLLLPPFVNGLVWVGIHVVRDVSLALMLYSHGNDMLSVVIWNAWTERSEIGVACAFGVLLIAFSAIIMLVGRGYIMRRSLSPSRERAT
jgi:iron(III) transport system permease protein